MTQPHGDDQIKELFSHDWADVGKGMRKQKGTFENLVYENALGVVTTIWSYLEATRSKVIEGIIIAQGHHNPHLQRLWLGHRQKVGSKAMRSLWRKTPQHLVQIREHT